MRHDGRDTHYSAVGRVRRAILFDGARLLLREIIPHRDRNDNYCGYNQSTDDIFHLLPHRSDNVTTVSDVSKGAAGAFAGARGNWATRVSCALHIAASDRLSD